MCVCDCLMIVETALSPNVFMCLAGLAQKAAEWSCWRTVTLVFDKVLVFLQDIHKQHTSTLSLPFATLWVIISSSQQVAYNNHNV